MADFCGGAGEGNRTLVVSLGSFCSTIELHPQDLVGARRHLRSRADRSGANCGLASSRADGRVQVRLLGGQPSVSNAANHAA